MVFDATLKNISVKSWWSVLLVEQTGGPGENHRLAAGHWQILSHNVVSRTPCHERDSNCKSNYHTIKTVTPFYKDFFLYLPYFVQLEYINIVCL
jgi:hypothetical protein